MRVLTACEYSGIVRSAFANMGWDAWSCDLLPTEIPGNHYQGDVLELINENWDLMIAFPPCTYLSYAGMAFWNEPGRAMKRIKAAEFFMRLYDAPVFHICVENPQGIMNQIFRKPDMTIHPYYFGESQLKRTCLWLKNLPKLSYQINDDLFGEKTSAAKPKPAFIDKSNKKRYFTDSIRHKEHSRIRSKTFFSIANAMAEQWTIFFNNNNYERNTNQSTISGCR